MVIQSGEQGLVFAGVCIRVILLAFLRTLSHPARSYFSVVVKSWKGM